MAYPFGSSKNQYSPQRLEAAHTGYEMTLHAGEVCARGNFPTVYADTHDVLFDKLEALGIPLEDMSLDDVPHYPFANL